MTTKYVVLKEAGHKPPTLIIFPSWLLHKEFQFMGEIISAGFINMKAKCCYGESISLNIKSDPEKDNCLLRLLFD